MTASVVAYLLLGSNLGDRSTLLSQARAQLADAGEVVAVSELYETAAWGLENQPAFLNQALGLRTTLSVQQLLAKCLATEQLAGRERLERWGSRTLDVDILLYGSDIVNEPHLVVPHPRLPERRFALAPLAEIAAEVRHPVLARSVQDLLASCPDPLTVRWWPS